MAEGQDEAKSTVGSRTSHSCYETIKSSNANESNDRNGQNLDYSFFNPDTLPHSLFGEIFHFLSERIDPFAREDTGEQTTQPKKVKKALTKSSVKPPGPRVDVQRRRMLRLIKKFYYELFKYHIDKLFNLRLTRIDLSVILESLQEFCRVCMKDCDSKRMAEFMFKFLRLNSNDCRNECSEAMAAGKRTYECTYRYGCDRYSALLECDLYHCLIRSYVGLKELHTSKLVGISKSIMWENQYQEQDRFFKSIVARYLHIGTNKPVEAALQDTYER